MDPNVQTCCGEIFGKTNITRETVNVNNASRILIKTRIVKQNVIMLYDPGSEYSVNRCGTGINNSKSQFNEVYVNVQFTRQDNSVYDLQYDFLD